MSERAAATVIAVVGSHAIYVSQPVSARNILSLRRRNMVPVLHQINLFVRSDGTRARPAEHGGWATVQVREPVTRLPGPASRVCQFALRVTAAPRRAVPSLPSGCPRTPAIPPRQAQAPR
jgi:hypothetical protein